MLSKCLKRNNAGWCKISVRKNSIELGQNEQVYILRSLWKKRDHNAFKSQPHTWRCVTVRMWTVVIRIHLGKHSQWMKTAYQLKQPVDVRECLITGNWTCICCRQVWTRNMFQVQHSFLVTVMIQRWRKERINVFCCSSLSAFIGKLYKSSQHLFNSTIYKTYPFKTFISRAALSHQKAFSRCERSENTVSWHLHQNQKSIIQYKDPKSVSSEYTILIDCDLFCESEQFTYGYIVHRSLARTITSLLWHFQFPISFITD